MQKMCDAGYSPVGCHLGHFCKDYNSTNSCYNNICPEPSCGPNAKLCKSNVFYGDNCPSYATRCIAECETQWSSVTETLVQCPSECQIDCQPNTEVKCSNGYDLEDGCSLGYSCYPVTSKYGFMIEWVQITKIKYEAYSGVLVIDFNFCLKCQTHLTRQHHALTFLVVAVSKFAQKLEIVSK